jgi:hypothetical protein
LQEEGKDLTINLAPVLFSARPVGEKFEAMIFEGEGRATFDSRALASYQEL